MNATITWSLQHLSGSLKTSLSSPINGGQPAYRRERQAAASAFLTRNRAFRNGCPGLDAVWLNSTVTGVAVSRLRSCVARSNDAEFLFVKNFGHSVFRWIKILFPDDVARLEDLPPVLVRRHQMLRFGAQRRWRSPSPVEPLRR